MRVRSLRRCAASDKPREHARWSRRMFFGAVGPETLLGVKVCR
jgi:hypothetical protein